MRPNSAESVHGRCYTCTLCIFKALPLLLAPVTTATTAAAKVNEQLVLLVICVSVDPFIYGLGASHWVRQYCHYTVTIHLACLRNNSVTDDGARALAALLSGSCQLRVVDLRNNNINKNGIRAIAEALERNLKITALDLGDNRIGLEGVARVAAAVQNTATITLELGGNRIGEISPCRWRGFCGDSILHFTPPWSFDLA